MSENESGQRMQYTTPTIRSSTYKFKALPIVEHAFYFTIAGYPKPSWFFINSKAMESFQWITALMTSYCIQLESDVSIEEIITQMKETFNPGGGYFLAGTTQHIPSIVHHLGLILEGHMAMVYKAHEQELTE